MKTRAQKEQSVQNLSQKLSESKSVIFADFQGLTMKHLISLRAELAKEGASLEVTKNTLLKIALKENQLPVPPEVEKGPTATVFAMKDEITPLKALVKALKEAQIGKIKIGLMGKDLLTAEQIQRLSTLPNKNELRAKLVGAINAPLYGLASVLGGNLHKLVYALDQIKRVKGGE